MSKFFPKAEEKGEIFKSEEKKETQNTSTNKTIYNLIIKKITENKFETKEKLFDELDSVKKIGQINEEEAEELLSLFNDELEKQHADATDFSDISSYEIEGKIYANTEITPDMYEKIDNVSILFYDEEELPQSLKLLKNLKILSVRESYRLKELPAWLPTLEHLEELDFHFSSIILNIAELVKLKNLKILNITKVKNQSISDVSNPNASPEEKEKFKQETMEKFKVWKEGVTIIK